MPLAEQSSTLHPHPRTCSYRRALLSLSAAVSSRPFVHVAIRLFRARDNLAPSFLSRDFSTYDPLYLPASFTREDPPARLLPLLPLSSPSSSPPRFSSMSSLLQGIAPVTLLWTEARSWHGLGAARSSGKVALGAYNVRCKTD